MCVFCFFCCVFWRLLFPSRFHCLGLRLAPGVAWYLGALSRAKPPVLHAAYMGFSASKPPAFLVFCFFFLGFDRGCDSGPPCLFFLNLPKVPSPRIQLRQTSNKRSPSRKGMYQFNALKRRGIERRNVARAGWNINSNTQTPDIPKMYMQHVFFESSVELAHNSLSIPNNIFKKWFVVAYSLRVPIGRA